MDTGLNGIVFDELECP